MVGFGSCILCGGLIFFYPCHLSQEGNLKYILYGVLVHAGWSTHSGHYYCFVRTSTGMWHSLDDNQV
jgi:ubiquitin C-terminal hydrolase